MARALLLLALLATVALADEPVPKRLAGPVFQQDSNGVRSMSILQPALSDRRSGNAAWAFSAEGANRVSKRLTIPPTAKRVSILSMASAASDVEASIWSARLAPGGDGEAADRVKPLHEAAAEVHRQVFERGASKTRLEQYDLVPLSESEESAISVEQASGSPVLVVLEDASRLELVVRYGHDRFVEGREVPVQVELLVAGGAAPSEAERGAIQQAEARLYVRRAVTGGPGDAPEEELELRRTAPGRWAGAVRIGGAGRHELRVHASAPREAERTVVDAVHAAGADARLEERPLALVSRDPRHPDLYAQVDIPVECRDRAACGPFELYAELFGFPAGAGASEAAAVPINWFGGIASVVPCGQTVSSDSRRPRGNEEEAADVPPLCVRGYVHLGWPALAGGGWDSAGLRNVRLRERETHVVVAEAEGAGVRDPEGLLQPPRPAGGLLSGILGAGGRRAPSLEMTEGPRPARHVQPAEATRGGAPSPPVRAAAVAPTDFAPAHSQTGLVVVHGYCADGSDWYLSNFTDAVRFMDYGQGVSNDEFARRLSVFGSSLATCTLAAHSQGGMASLHMRNFYHSCLDGNTNRTGGARLIQTVGTPFHGSSIAGRWASIFGLLGYGCGSVADLTPTGAELWLSYMRDEARRDVYYFATRSPAGELPCDRRTDLLLLKPNDGATENLYNQLAGANSMGVTEAECHMDMMNYPSQTLNGSRNVDISRHAARLPIPRVIRSDYLGLILGVMGGLIAGSLAVGLAVRWYRARHAAGEEDLEASAPLPAAAASRPGASERTPLLAGHSIETVPRAWRSSIETARAPSAWSSSPSTPPTRSSADGLYTVYQTAGDFSGVRLMIMHMNVDATALRPAALAPECMPVPTVRNGRVRNGTCRRRAPRGRGAFAPAREWEPQFGAEEGMVTSARHGVAHLSALAHVEPAKAELAVQYAAPGASAVADDDPARIGFLPAQPRLADGDRFRKDVRNYQSAQPTKYLFGPDAAGGQEYTKSEALAGVIVGRIRPGALRAVIERKRDLYEASIAGLERDRATLRRLELVPANLRSADDDATILALQQSCAHTITAWIHKARPHAARRALTEPYTGEDPRSWHDWFLPLVRHTLPTGQRLAVYYAECLRTALEARATSEDPEYQNLDVRMAGFAKLNERTLREFLTALDQRILALDGALSPLQLDDLFLQACETHGCRTVLPPQAMVAPEAPETKRPRVRKMAVAADDEDEPDEAVPTKSVHAAPGTKAPPGAPVLSRRHPDEENLGYPCTTTTPCPLCMHVEMPALDRCHFTWNCAWGTAPFPGIPYADWVKGIAEKRAGLKRRERATREDEGPTATSAGTPARTAAVTPTAVDTARSRTPGAVSKPAAGSAAAPAAATPAAPAVARPPARTSARWGRGNAQSGRGRGYGPEQNRGPRPRFNQVRAGGDPPRSEPQPLTDGPDRKTSAAPQSRSAALHASNSRQRSSLHFPTPAADPGDLTGYGPDRPSDLAVPESPEGAPPGSLNAPIPIAHVIDGISGRPHDFRRLQLQCPGFVYALNADGTLGASTRVQILFDTGAMGEVGEKRHMPPGTRYTGVKVLRAFLHHATITAEIAHVVLRFGDVYVSRAVYVVPDGSLGPNADLLVGIGTIMMVEGG
eukprot:tig00000448_g914.t1